MAPTNVLIDAGTERRLLKQDTQIFGVDTLAVNRRSSFVAEGSAFGFRNISWGWANGWNWTMVQKSPMKPEILEP